MTLTLTPDTEEHLRSVAALRGQTPEEAISALLAEAAADFAAIVMNEEESQQVLAASRRSEEDFAAGRWISLKDYELHTLILPQGKMLGFLCTTT